MARTVYVQNVLNGGEFSPRLALRSDIAQYKNAVSEMVNMVPLPHGGAVSRNGLRYVGKSVTSTYERLVPFTTSTGVSYVLELGNNIARVFSNGGYVTTASGTITNVTNNAGLYQITTSAPHGLTTTNKIIIQGVPVIPINQEWNVTVIDTTNFTLDFSTFQSGYIGGGTFLRPTDFSTPFTSAQLPTVRWGQYGDVLYFVHKDVAPQSFTVNPFQFSQTVLLDGPYLDANLVVPGGAKSTITLTPSAVTGSVTLTASAALFTAADVGRSIRMLQGTTWGWGRITAFTSATSVTFQVESTLTSTAAKTTWRLGAFSANTTVGYPQVLGVYQQRLIFASTPGEPQKLWLSSTNEPQDFAPSATTGTIAQSDAVTYQLGAVGHQSIKWLVGGQHLQIGTSTEEFIMHGANNEAISATNLPIVKVQGNDGSAPIDAIRQAAQTVYVQRGMKELRVIQYDLATDVYQSTEMSLFVEHRVQASQIVGVYNQTRPHHVLLVLLASGNWLTFTFYPVEKVQGWAFHQTQGQVESIAVVPDPNTGNDVAWFLVNRNGKRFVEVEDTAFHVDSGLRYSGTPATQFSAIEHLNGSTVKVLGDGAVYDDQVVADGIVTLKYGFTEGPAASEVIVGLPITPSPQFTTLEPALENDQIGSTRNRLKQWATCYVSVQDTAGAVIQGVELPHRKPGDPMDEPSPALTGSVKVSTVGWSREAPITVTQPQPYPIMVRGVFGDLNIGD